MNSVEMKKELHQIIYTGDDEFVKLTYEMAKLVSDICKKIRIAQGERRYKSWQKAQFKRSQKISGQLGIRNTSFFKT